MTLPKPDRLPDDLMGSSRPDLYSDRFYFYLHKNGLRLAFGHENADGTVSYHTVIRAPRDMIVDLDESTSYMRAQIEQLFKNG